jgi:hypothetical protein
MIIPGSMLLPTTRSSRTISPASGPAGRSRGRIALLIVMAALATRAVSPASAQLTPPTPDEATSPTAPCLAGGQDLIMPPEIKSSDGVLQGIISLTEEFQLLPPTAAGNKNCPKQRVRVYRPGLPSPASDDLLNPMPGPILRARVGDLVQLTFVNTVDANRFDRNVVIGPNGCMQVGAKGNIYPGDPKADVFPNCLHASSTANIHYHGTHTNPDATGDNVFLQILPLPRDNAGNPTTSPAEATAGLEQFFKDCIDHLKDRPLDRWPTRWSDMPLDWIKKQTELLMAYQTKNPDQTI